MSDEKMEIIIKSPDAIERDDKDDLIAKYITPDPNCPCCNLPKLSIRINEAYLNGFNYTEIIEKFGENVQKAIGKKLDIPTVSAHFTKHFNFKGAAIAEYNRKRGLSRLPQEEKKEIKNIFDTIVSDQVNDLELLQLAMKEQVKRLKELEELKQQRIEQKRTFNLDELITKQEMITNNIINNVLNKLKFWQKAQYQSKTAEQRDRYLDFLDAKTADFLGIDISAIKKDPKLAQAAEKLYLTIVIEHILKRVKDSMQMSIGINTNQMSHFLKEFNRQCTGIENEIAESFNERIKNLKEVKAL